MTTHQPGDVRAQAVRVPKAIQRGSSEPGAAFSVVAVRAGFAEVMEERRQTNGQRRIRVGGGLHDGKDVLVEGKVLPVAVLLEADRRVELRQQGRQHTCVARESERPRGPASKEELRELTQTVCVQPA